MAVWDMPGKTVLSPPELRYLVHPQQRTTQEALRSTREPVDVQMPLTTLSRSPIDTDVICTLNMNSALGEEKTP